MRRKPNTTTAKLTERKAAAQELKVPKLTDGLSIFCFKACLLAVYSLFVSLLADGVKGDIDDRDGEEMKNFNEDILCYHGLFSLDKTEN